MKHKNDLKQPLMNKFTFITAVMLMLSGIAISQNKTDISLLWKDSLKQVPSVGSVDGNLYKMLMHHGPAIENEWVGYRLYFDFKTAIDVYNKQKPQLELGKALWYPTPEQQKKGWGSDQYKVGQTVGLGGIRLWDGEKVVFLNPVSRRSARVVKEGTISYMEMLSEGIPYQNRKVDILVRVTVYSGIREAKVEAFALTDEPVMFMTGINHHKGMQTWQAENTIATWGIHPEDVAAFPMNIGSAIRFNPNDYTKIEKGDKEYQLISKPGKYISLWITSACENEKKMTTADAFIQYVNQWGDTK